MEGGHWEETFGRSPCLLCGDGIDGAEVPVKQEVPVFNNGNDCEVDYSIFGGDGGDRDKPCFKWSEEEKEICQWFGKWFHLGTLGLPASKKSKRVGNFGWDGVSGKDPFPFCGDCKNRLGEVLECQRKVEELQKLIQEGIEKMKEKASEREERFGRSGLYQKDGRYGRVRKLIVKDFKLRYPKETKRIVDKPLVQSRKSTRKKSSGLPVDLLTSVDKQNAEQYLPEADTKPNMEEPLGAGLRAYGTAIEYSIRGKMRSARKRKAEATSTTSPSKRSEPKNDPSVLEEVKATAFEDGNDDLLEDERRDAGGEFDYMPESPPPTKSKKRRKLIKKPKELDEDSSPRVSSSSKKLSKRPPHFVSVPDEDWELDASEDSADDDPDIDEDYEVNLETGKRQKSKVTLDPSKSMLFYKNLAFHRLEPFSSNLYQCTTCNSTVKHNSTRGNIRNHYLKYHTDIYACPQCPYRASSKFYLRYHISTAHEGAPKKDHNRSVFCSICQKPTTSQRLKSHEWSHLSSEEKLAALSSGDPSRIPANISKRHQCDQCGHHFASSGGLQKHQDNVHATSEEKQSKMELCPECGGTFLRLRQHLQMVHGLGAKVYACLEDNCNKSFRSLTLLTKHKNAVHRKLRPFKCTLCPREFSGPGSFKNHMNLHLGVRPFQCAHCPSAFTTKSNWQRHTALYHTPGGGGEGKGPRRKPYTRGPTMLGSDVRKRELVNEGKYLPPSALATWAAGREPTSHFPQGSGECQEDAS